MGIEQIDSIAIKMVEARKMILALVNTTWVSEISGMEWWNGILEWTRTKSFHLHIIYHSVVTVV